MPLEKIQPEVTREKKVLKAFLKEILFLRIVNTNSWFFEGLLTAVIHSAHICEYSKI